MRRLPAALLYALVWCVLTHVQAARASDAGTILAYARALRAFNPYLSESRAARWAQTVIEEADAQALDARLLVALIAVESNWRPRAVSSAGAIGLGQLMPATAGGLGVDARDPRQNIHGVAVHLRGLLDRYASSGPAQRYTLALAAYNAGTGAVARFRGVPPYAQTQAYVRRVIGLWRRLAGEAP